MGVDYGAVRYPLSEPFELLVVSGSGSSGQSGSPVRRAYMKGFNIFQYSQTMRPSELSTILVEIARYLTSIPAFSKNSNAISSSKYSSLSATRSLGER